MDAMVATSSTTTTIAETSFLATKTSLHLEPVLSGAASDPFATSAFPWSHDSGYDLQRSTEENYRSDRLSKTSGDDFFGDFKEFRRRLDRSYHNDYVPVRQALQDTIIKSLLSIGNNCEERPLSSAAEKNWIRDERGSSQEQEYSLPTEHLHTTAPWIVFTAGVYGAGKSHTIGKLQALGCFPPRSSFVAVDPDEIRRMLPEFSLYGPDKAGAMTQKEAGMVAELLTDVALSSGKKVVVDGSLRDATWHAGYFQRLRSRFGNDSNTRQDDRDLGSTTKDNLRIGILYVTAPVDEIYQRVEQRGASTGRAVPPEFLERSMREVPKAIEQLKPLADFFLHVHNSQTKEDEEETKGEREQDSFSPFVVDAEDGDNPRFPSSPTGKKEHSLMKSEIEITIFQDKCQSIVY